ncbi:MAG: hypothetical protein JO182_19875 [Acidobacteriaceae bacterium]|nr:hypothetical protein [Acidobacteriaceae bacterium]
MANKVRDFKSALGSSMRAEQNRATDRQLDRFARAEAIMDSGGGKSLELERPERERVVRDSFTLPAMDYQRIARIQERALKAGFHANKSEIMRAGLLLLDEFSDNELTSALSRVEKIKTGRPTDKSV